MFKKQEKTNYTNHKNRKYSILLLALLFIGVATYGTYAYFTDSKNVAGELKLNNGSVTLGAIKDQTWTYQSNTGAGDDLTKPAGKNPNITPSDPATQFSNVLPGDTFSKTVEVDYTGTNNADATIALDTGKTKGMIVSYTVTKDGKELDTSNAFPLVNRDKLTFTLTAHVPYKEAENAGGRNNQDSPLTDLTNAITITATQQLIK